MLCIYPPGTETDEYVIQKYHEKIKIAFSATNLKPPCRCTLIPFSSKITREFVEYYLSKVIISHNGVQVRADRLARNHEIYTSIILKKMFPKELTKLMSEYFGIYHWLVHDVVGGW
jgi:hypothetical protein